MISADSNVFIYLWDNDALIKAGAAQQVLTASRARGCAIGLQVIGEVQNVLRRKLGQPPWEAAQNARNLLISFNIFAPVPANSEEALSLMAAGRMSYWDALLATAARDAGCTVFFTEDMADGSRFGPMEIINPFGPDGPSPRARELLDL